MSIRISLLLIAVASVLSEAGAQPTAAKPLKRYELTGVVTDKANLPIASAELGLVVKSGIVNPVYSGSDGRFVIPDLPSGKSSVRVRRLGYRAQTVSVDVPVDEEVAELRIGLEPIPDILDPVLIVDQESREMFPEFYARKDRRTFGIFIEAKDIAKRGPLFASDLLRTVPGAMVRQGMRLGNVVRIRGCQPMVWIDGSRVPGAEVDDLIQPADIAGMEIYNSWAGIPAQYTERENKLCGAIIVWTKKR
jgi:hypothetical protein